MPKPTTKKNGGTDLVSISSTTDLLSEASNTSKRSNMSSSSIKSVIKERKEILEKLTGTPHENLLSFLRHFQNRRKSHSGEKIPWTHSMTDEPYGSYNIPDDYYSDFQNIYTEAVLAGSVLHITERHREQGPIVIDLDFKQNKTNSGRYYTNKTLYNIVVIYNKIIKKYLNVTSAQLSAHVLEKAKPTLKNGEYGDGIHIVYPHICTKPNLQLLFREEFIEEVKKTNIFKKIPFTNSLEDVVDKQVIYHSGWLMYGSQKTKHSEKYVLTHIYQPIAGMLVDSIMPGDNIQTKTWIKYLVNALSCRRYIDERSLSDFNYNVDPSIIDGKINSMKTRIIAELNGVDSDQKSEILKNLIGSDTQYVKAVSEQVLAEAKNLVKLFSKERAAGWFTWYQVGRCLHNIDHRLLDDWIQFSKKCPQKFKPGECENLWRRMKNNNYTMATVHYFASHDNPREYGKMQRENFNSKMRDGLDCSNGSIAKVVIAKYRYRFKCASIKHNIWYEYENHRWKEIDTGYSIRKLIDSEISAEYIKYQKYLYSVVNETQGREKENALADTTDVQKLLKKLNDINFRKNVVNACADELYDPNFLKYLDENINIICFENGIYDLEADCFREGCPDDYVSICTDYPYIPYDSEDIISKEINDFLSKIQTKPHMREYLLRLLSTCIAGSISEESFYVFTGTGANGKSKLMELMKYTLGGYFKPMDIRLLTEKRASSSSASPELADKKGIRLCVFDEPKATDEINTGFMKLFTGGDTITARALFKEPIYFKPQFKSFLLCNDLPAVGSDDDGTWRRIRVIPFTSKFLKRSDINAKTTSGKKLLKDGPNASEGKFWADLKITEKIPDWKQMFMGMLINSYRTYNKEGLIHPKEVTKESDSYRKKCDIYQDFIGDVLEKTNDEGDVLSISTIHGLMRAWFKTNQTSGRCPNTKDLRTYIEKRIAGYTKTNDSLSGYRINGQGGEDNAEKGGDDIKNFSNFDEKN